MKKIAIVIAIILMALPFVVGPIKKMTPRMRIAERANEISVKVRPKPRPAPKTITIAAGMITDTGWSCKAAGRKNCVYVEVTPHNIHAKILLHGLGEKPEPMENYIVYGLGNPSLDGKPTRSFKVQNTSGQAIQAQITCLDCVVDE